MVRVAFRLPLVLVAAAMLCASACQRGPAVPTLASFGTLDPAVSSLLAEQLAAVTAAPADANRWGVLGLALEANGLAPAAKDAYATATTLDATHGRWWYHLGRQRAREGDVDGALAAFDNAIERSPDYVPLRWRRGQLLLDRGDYAGAEAAFRVAVNLAPGDGTAATGLARVHLAMGRADEAVRTLDALLERAPADRFAYQVLATSYRALGRMREADEAAAAGAAGEPQPIDPWLDEMGGFRRGFAAMLKDATALGVGGRTNEAIAILERLRSERPDDTGLQTYLAGLYATAGRTGEAKPLLGTLLAANADDFDATMNLATAHLFDRAFDEADATVVRALAIRPGDPDATRLRGVVAWRRERLDDAERWLAEAAAANPKDAKALAWIGSIRLQRGHIRDAHAAYRDALARDPLLVDALTGGAQAALAAGALEDAERWLARANRLAPGRDDMKALAGKLAARRTR